MFLKNRKIEKKNAANHTAQPRCIQPNPRSQHALTESIHSSTNDVLENSHAAMTASTDSVTEHVASKLCTY